MFKKFSPNWIIPLVILDFTLSAASVSADDSSDGKELYKASKFTESASKFEAASKADPKDANIWWQLNFTYHKLKRETDSLAAVKKAGVLDPKGEHNDCSPPNSIIFTK